MQRSRRRITLFSFGYWGWGSSTSELIKAVDTIEGSRGYRPPLFVDIRIRRSVRAAGFDGNAFGDLLGNKRYRWMKELGNLGILDKAEMRIADPKAANDLLELAEEAARDKRRVIFFCACPRPRQEGRVSCHRSVVATLVLKAARRRRINVEVVEWPGGEPAHLTFALAPAMFRSVVNGRMMIPLPAGAKLGILGGPPWGSIATFRHGVREVHRLVGPVTWHKDQWCLPVSTLFFDPEVTIPAYRKESVRLRKSEGLDPRTSTPK